jgi:hypothetical protein
MAGTVLNAEANRLLDLHLTDGLYVAAFTTAPNAAGTGGVEPSGNGYARKQTNFAAAASRAKRPSADVVFDQTTGPWGTIVAVGYMTAASGGTCRAVVILDEPKAIAQYDILVLRATEIVATLPE